MQTAADVAETDATASAEVRLTGTFREVNWITRTAQLYDEHDRMTTVRFTPEQDGWLKLVANIPVNLKGTRAAPHNGQPAPDADSNGNPEPDCLLLTEVKVIQKNWFPYDDDAFWEVRRRYRYDPDTHPRLSFRIDTNEFMRSIRGPDYRGSGE